MEPLLIMDTGSESLGGSMWLTSSLSPTYQELSPGRPTQCDTLVGQQVSSTLKFISIKLSLRGLLDLPHRPRSDFDLQNNFY